MPQFPSLRSALAGEPIAVGLTRPNGLTARTQDGPYAPESCLRFAAELERQAVVTRKRQTAHCLDPLEYCHLEGADLPFKTQLQTAWVSFGKQARVTSRKR